MKRVFALCLCLATFADIECPARLQVDGGAVRHLNKAKGAVFNGVLFGIPRTPGIGGVRSVSQLAEDRAGDRGHFVVAHQPEREIQRMGADVNERPTALLLFV